MKIDYSLFPQKLAIDRFIFAVENGYYAEAHELLEDDWRDLKKSGFLKESQVLKGLINGATALALFYKKKKVDGYKKVWKVFLKYEPLLDEVEMKNKARLYFARNLLVKLNKQVEASLC
jgi:hypothetical protein